MFFSFREFWFDQKGEKKRFNGEKNVVGYNWHNKFFSFLCLLGRSDWTARANQQKFWSVCRLKQSVRCPFFSSSVVLKGFPCWIICSKRKINPNERMREKQINLRHRIVFFSMKTKEVYWQNRTLNINFPPHVFLLVNVTVFPHCFLSWGKLKKQNSSLSLSLSLFLFAYILFILFFFFN